jgi:hypothetical protein
MPRARSLLRRHHPMRAANIGSTPQKCVVRGEECFWMTQIRSTQRRSVLRREDPFCRAEIALS